MITIDENGKKILRLSLQKAVITAITTLLVSAISFIGLGFKLAFTDHFTLENTVKKIEGVEQSLQLKYVNQDIYIQDKKLTDQRYDSLDKKVDLVNNNVTLILNKLIND